MLCPWTRPRGPMWRWGAAGGSRGARRGPPPGRPSPPPRGRGAARRGGGGGRRGGRGRGGPRGGGGGGGPPPPRVVWAVDGATDAAILELRAADDVGLLYRVAHALEEAGADLRAARISTLGADVVDAFYLRGDWSETQARV